MVLCPVLFMCCSWLWAPCLGEWSGLVINTILSKFRLLCRDRPRGRRGGEMEEKAGDLLFKLDFKLVLVHWWNIEPGAGETCGYSDAAGDQGNDAAGDRLEDEKRVWHRHHQQHTALVMVTITIMIIFSVPRAPIIITTMIIAEHVITGATLGPDQGLIYFPRRASIASGSLCLGGLNLWVSSWWSWRSWRSWQWRWRRSCRQLWTCWWWSPKVPSSDLAIEQADLSCLSKNLESLMKPHDHHDWLRWLPL